MKRFFLLIFVCLPGMIWAQKFALKGQLTDTLSSPMPSATLMLLSPKDSTLVNFGVSDSKGYFEIKNIARGSYLFKVSFVGFETYMRSIAPDAGQTEIQLGQIKLRPIATELDELVVKGEKNPVTVKRDTIEFNASSFKVQPNANVEDLLKKMPGVEVESDGTIRAQGEQVQRVTVDGREFFGRDPKLATRNLPADAIDKVQVFDKKSEQATFTGIDDGQKEKTINLELKEEKRNGAFGTLMAGAGNNDRFQGRANINKFGKGRQLSFLGMGNNINEQGFSIDDYMNFSGGTQQIMGGGGSMRIQIDGDNSSGVPLNFGGRQNGIMSNYAGGLNANRDLNGDKTKLNGSYFYSRVQQNVSDTINRTNFLPDNRSYNFYQSNRQLSLSDNHRANFTADHSIDSANSIRFNSSLTYGDSEQRTTSQSKTMSVDNELQNESERSTFTQGTSTNWNSSLLYRHRFAKKGRSLSNNLTFGLSQSVYDGTLASSNQFYAIPSELNILQSNEQSTSNVSYGTTLAYTEPLGKRKYLEANYSFRANANEVDRKVYDQQPSQPVLDERLTNHYNSDYIYHRPGVNLRVNRQKFNLTVGAAYQATDLKGEISFLNRDTTIHRMFENVLPVARFNYDFSSFRHVRLDYETSMQEPTIQQLQPVVDNRDPLNISIGNPALRPGYNHRLNLNFTTFDPAKFINFFAFVNAIYTTNAISTSQSVSPELVRVTMPVNVADNLVVSSNMNLGFPIRKLKSRFSFGPTSTNTESINILNGEENRASSQALGGTVRYNFNWNDIFILDLSSNVSNQKTHYEANSKFDQEYINETYTAESNLTLLKNYQLSGSFEYLVYNSRTTGFSQTIPLLNLAVSRFLLKNNTGELKVGVNNLLDRSLSVTQTANANYLQQQKTNNLGRYFMVSFTYSLNKQLNPMGAGPRRGGMRMMIRN